MSAPYASTGFQMIRSIEIKNFRCYEDLKIDECGRLNVIVGPNGAGKTALLESIFLPLGASTEVPVRLRVQRGMDGALGGSRSRIESGLWGDFFYENDTSRTISLKLDGDGAERRSLIMKRAPSEKTLPLNSDSFSVEDGPIEFKWIDSRGFERVLKPHIAQTGTHFPETGEDLPNFFHFPANQTIGTGELATNFSDLTLKRLDRKFIDTFSKEYPVVEDIKLLIHGGSAMLFAKLRNSKLSIPIPNLSGGINRILGMQLAIASRPKSVLTVDEIENGIYYKSMESVWRSLLTFIKDFDSQMFVTTHSAECIEALIVAAGDEVSDIALWRLEREATGTIVLRQFSGQTLRAGLASGGEVR